MMDLQGVFFYRNTHMKITDFWVATTSGISLVCTQDGG